MSGTPQGWVEIIRERLRACSDGSEDSKKEPLPPLTLEVIHEERSFGQFIQWRDIFPALPLPSESEEETKEATADWEHRISSSQPVRERRERPLATIARLGPVNRHPSEGPNGNKHEITRVFGGYPLVLPKGYAREGDIGVYFELDSVLPLQTPTSIVAPLKAIVGQDVTALLGVTKRTDTADTGSFTSNSSGSALTYNKLFPSGPGETEECRMERSEYMLRVLTGKPYYITEKADGTSLTVQLDPKSRSILKVASRSQQLYPSTKNAGHYWRSLQHRDVQAKLIRASEESMKNRGEWEGKEAGEGRVMDVCDLIFQGECVGPGVQGNKLGLKQNDWLIFTIFDVRKQQRLGLVDMERVLQKLGLVMVKIVERGENFQYSREEIGRKSVGKYEGTSNWREGIVVRSEESVKVYPCPEKSDSWEWLSFKKISDPFLLKEAAETTR